MCIQHVVLHLYLLTCRYMKRRCDFLDCLPAFNYNLGTGEYIQRKSGRKPKLTDTSHLGSTLLSTMISEVCDLCDPNIRENWTHKAHQQVIIVVVLHL